MELPVLRELPTSEDDDTGSQDLPESEQAERRGGEPQASGARGREPGRLWPAKAAKIPTQRGVWWCPDL